MVAWRYEISLLELKKIFHSFAALTRATLEEKFRISARLCNILYVSNQTQNIQQYQTWFMQYDRKKTNRLSQNLLCATFMACIWSRDTTNSTKFYFNHHTLVAYKIEITSTLWSLSRRSKKPILQKARPQFLLSGGGGGGQNSSELPNWRTFCRRYKCSNLKVYYFSLQLTFFPFPYWRTALRKDVASRNIT